MAFATAAPVAAVTAVPVGAIGQQVTVAVNTAFNELFTRLGGVPANPISGVLEGALVLVRRTVFGLVPTGVTATLNGSTLAINVDPGSVAYFRQNGSSLQVSGDPVFFRLLNEQEFGASSVQTVQATNAAGGHAGLVFTTGDVAASLETTGIDSLNFGADALFDGSVTSSLASGTLVIYNAVRGKTGVTLDAPAIQLATDVDVEAESLTGTAPGVRFTGTVDATTAGGQSLTVTALGTTTFEKAVGGLTPLGSLLTQGIAPLDIPQIPGTSQTIPLYFMPLYSATAPAEVKTGIPVAIGDNPSQFYTFDGGGEGFAAGYSPNFWNGVSLVGPSANEEYGKPGTIYLNGVAVTTPITIGERGNSVTTGPIALVAGLENKPAGYTNPDAGAYNGRFFGDFGVSFAYNNSAPRLTSALWQLPGNLSNGFLVQLGPIGSDGQLTMGAPQALTDQFPYAIEVPLATDPSEPNYPVSGYKALAKGFDGIYEVSRDGVSHYLNEGVPIKTILDTGNPSTWVKGVDEKWFKDAKGDQIQPGTKFTATFVNHKNPTNPLVWSFVTGDQPSVNIASYQDDGSGKYSTEVNAGLNIYNQFDVLFDAENKLVHLRPNGGQSTLILSSSVKTTGAQSYQQGNVTLNGDHGTTTGMYTTGGGTFAVAGVTTLGGNTTIDAGTGGVRFSGTVDSGIVDGNPATDFRSLTVNTTGPTTFVSAVGWFRQLLSLTNTGGGPISTASVATKGSQTYGGDVSLSGPYWVYDTNSAFSVAGATTLAGLVSVNACGGAGAPERACADTGASITFDGPVDSLARKGFSLSVAAGDDGVVEFKGAVGGTNPLGGLAIDSANTVTALGTVSLDGSLGYAWGEGLRIGDSGDKGSVRTANFAGGGSIVGFQTTGGTPNGTCSDQRPGACGSGVVVNGAPSGSIQGFTIADNDSYGIYVTNQPLTLIQTGNQFVGNASPEGPLTGP